MRRLRPSALLLPFAGFFLTLAFQNCDAGFRYDPSSGELLSAGLADLNEGDLRLKILDANDQVVGDSALLQPNIVYDVYAAGANLSEAVLLWGSLATNNTAGCRLSATGELTRRELKCTAAGTVEISVEALWGDGSESTASLTRSVAAAPTPTPGGGGQPQPGDDPNRVDFHITAGTGNKPWNTANAPVVVFVGQTLRIYNDDTVPHRLRTAGSPCASQANDTAPGAYFDCVVSSTHAPTATDLYDNAAGASAIFYVNALNGQALYSDTSRVRCVQCHGAFATSTKRGSSYTTIKSALQNVGAMSFINLTDEEIRAIAYSLSK